MDVLDDDVIIPVDDDDDDDDTEILKLTASFVDAVNVGNRQLALEILENETLDLDIDMGVLERYSCSLPPKARVDLLDTMKNVAPEQPIGSIFIRSDAQLLERLMQSTSRPANITDHDALICIYISDVPTFTIAMDNYPNVLINKKLKTTTRTQIPCLKSFKQSFPNCFTPLHAVLHSFFVYRKLTLYYTRTLSSFKAQRVKMHLLLAQDAFLDGNMPYMMSVAGQLIFHEEDALFEKCVNMGVLKIDRYEMDTLFHQFVRYYKLESITYIFESDFCNHLDFVANDEYLGHYALVRKGYLRRLSIAQQNVITELLLNKHFTFVGNFTYKLQWADSASRLYNLFHAGVYIHDGINSYQSMDQTNPVVRELGRILQASKSPYSLERLCGFKIRSIVGPKHHYFKLKLLAPYVPKHVLQSVGVIRFTKNGSMPPFPYIPEERVGQAPYSDVFVTTKSHT